jgi:hypothetical protein
MFNKGSEWNVWDLLHGTQFKTCGEKQNNHRVFCGE